MKTPSYTNICSYPNNTLKSVKAVLFLSCLLLGMEAAHSQDVQFSDNALFIPQNSYSVNPLENRYQGKTQYFVNATGLSNQQLEQAAQNISSENMSMEHRALNHQWLDNHSRGKRIQEGGAAISAILKKGFSTYWNSIRASKFKTSKLMPDGDGSAEFAGGYDYKVNLSSNKLKLAINYEF